MHRLPELRRIFEEPRRDAPRGLWTFDGTGPKAFDRSGGDRHGSLIGSVFPGVPGPAGFLATYFTETNRYEVPHASAFDVTTAITLEAWIRFGTSAIRQIACKNTDSFFFRVAGGGIEVFLNGVSSGWLRTTKVYNDWRWHHVAVRWSQSLGAIEIYVDGVLDVTLARSGTIPTGTSAIVIADRYDDGANRGYVGVIGLFGLYAKALDPTRIRTHWQAGARPGSRTR